MFVVFAKQRFLELNILLLKDNFSPTCRHELLQNTGEPGSLSLSSVDLSVCLKAIKTYSPGTWGAMFVRNALDCLVFVQKPEVRPPIELI